MEHIDVRILDRDYRLAVSAEDKPRLQEAARMVDERMRSIRDAGRVGTADRIAVLAALQLADELLGGSQSSDAARQAELTQRLRRMNDQIATEIKRQENLF
ncbi:MAG: hypothetical protein RI906_3295 [Pseudomonadota bacterium]|jgi:cell division protein ZapA